VAFLLEGALEQARHPHLVLDHEHPHNARLRRLRCEGDESRKGDRLDVRAHMRLSRLVHHRSRTIE
jgi:hypothetical protein